MSTTGKMGAVESFTWLLSDGDTMTVTVDRGKLALAMARKISPRFVGGPGRKRVTGLFGGVVAKRSKTR